MRLLLATGVEHRVKENETMWVVVVVVVLVERKMELSKIYIKAEGV